MKKDSDTKCAKCDCPLEPGERKRCCDTDHCPKCIVKHFEESHRPVGDDEEDE